VFTVIGRDFSHVRDFHVEVRVYFLMMTALPFRSRLSYFGKPDAVSAFHISSTLSSSERQKREKYKKER